MKKTSSIKSAIKQKINSITPEQKEKAKKVAIKALKIAGAVAITAVAAYAGYKGVTELNAANLIKVKNQAANATRWRDAAWKKSMDLANTTRDYDKLVRKVNSQNTDIQQWQQDTLSRMGEKLYSAKKDWSRLSDLEYYTKAAFNVYSTSSPKDALWYQLKYAGKRRKYQ